MKKTNLVKKVFDILKKIPDPELGISILDLGLIYNVKADEKGKIEVLMTLTTMGCPLFDMMATPIKTEVGKIKGVTDVDIELTFDPPWSPDLMVDGAKVKLGFF
ncbi:hypothetical protein COV53_00260 [Candidatus Gottesmanbacteria bacterium CG11_big_fil_rev_8_21_14_0_20_37_11]|uniref:MIP18 family-like domain-containing protein n=3 Tax=Candidatus Gottesmaniibacteriota TaxID=1752720 RepID=A0A2M7RQS5_9BACT|nr:MAG: hypothetical protein AUJ73_05055 [Candidatus Gottesmanbacteria bacterium CG1_02_37_22]PIP33103.1 MAG: hypothetical protein COX23_01145 [Candidatus Gottesmanbacteria bacterium CG23_combo_of_CG06-09_8_20_14_all_37_19]PIR08957.1 MAG: hypothetical protein COV53_00260 [Candidatus Gottesmanbacteria bacterium CG11_big_fil_rev_8_21_14_0_20_37_11]PIZ02656.1 MAG: hypothetical protein COY59_03615 [Candidatus Gottesmanbacteria bacterium CG_4_10_14_0_8_um_filter_37_24]